jgi:nitronate monooxygenase
MRFEAAGKGSIEVMLMNIPNLKIGHLNSRVPIVQGGMGVGISLSGLASAVANEGGIGVIAAAMIGIHEPDITTNSPQANTRALKREIRIAREKTAGILGVNIMVALTDFDALVRASIEEGADIIFSGAGLPLNLPGFLTKGDRTKLIPIVSSGRAAAIICKKWWRDYKYVPDGFVVEGPKAGGHIGFKYNQVDHPDFSLENITSEVINTLRTFEEKYHQSIPVIAAGGIFTGEDIYKFLKLGAAGVQMGTRFVATHECDADNAFKQVYVDAEKEDMAIVKSPVGLPGRVVRNRFIDQVNQGEKKPFKCPFKCIKTCIPHESPFCIALALANAQKGRFKNGFAFAGKNAYRIKEIISVKELIDALKTEFLMADSYHRASAAPVMTDRCCAVHF